MALSATGLDALDVELLAYIFEYVGDTSPHSLRSLALVNRLCNEVTKLVADSRMKIAYEGYKEEFSPKLLKSLIENERLLRRVRYLTLTPLSQSNWIYDDRAHSIFPTVTNGHFAENNVSVLASFIEKLGNLRVLTWETAEPIPLQVLNALHLHHPKAELKVIYFTRIDILQDHTDPAEIALSTSPALTLIRIVITNRDLAQDFREAAFQRIVANAPNLKHASIILKTCDTNIGKIYVFDNAEYDRRIAKFHNRKRPNTSLRSLTLDGYRLDNDTFSEWSEYVDWSKLETINCTRGLPDASFLKEAPRILKTVKRLKLNLRGRANDDHVLNGAIQLYIETCPLLESISLWSFEGALRLLPLLERHGEGLKSLQFHQSEGIWTLDRSVLSLQDIKFIRQNCPNLRKLSLDINRKRRRLEVKDYKEVLGELSKINLDVLQLCYDLGSYTIDEINCRKASTDDYVEDTKSSDTEDEEEHNQTNDSRTTLRRRAREYIPTGSQVLNYYDITPSSCANIERHVQEVWKVIFGHKITGPRALDVKFGEFQRKSINNRHERWQLQETHMRTSWRVRPHERDDRKGECWVYASGKRVESQEWREFRKSDAIPKGVNLGYYF